MKRIRFSLRSLLLLVFTIGGAMGIFWRWEPWVPIELDSPMYLPAVSPDKKLIGTISMDGDLRVWNANDASLKCELSNVGFACHLRFSSDSRRLLVWGRTAEIWDIQSRSRICVISGIPNWSVNVIFTPDGSKLLHVSDALRGYSVPDGRLLFEIGMPYQPPVVAVSPAQSASAELDGAGKIASQETDLLKYNETLRRDTSLHPRYKAAASPDGRFIVTRYQTEMILWDAQTLQRLRTIARPFKDGEAFAFSEDGKLLLILVRYRNGSTDVYDTASGRQLGSFECSFLWFSLDHSQLLVGEVASPNSEPRTVNLLNLATGKMQYLGQYYRWQNADLEMKRAVTVEDDGTYIKSLPELKPLCRLAYYRGEPVSFASNGNTFVTYNHDDKFEMTCWLRRRPEEWWGVAWLPDFWIASISGIALLWSLRRDWRERARKI